MTFPAAPGAPQELLATYISVIPSLAGSQEILRDAARLGAEEYARTFESVATQAMRPAVARIGASMAEGLSAGLGASAGQHILSKLLPSESAVAGHMGRLGKSAAGAYTQEFNAKYRDMVPVIEDVSAKAVAANKALVETTRAMGGQMSSFWYRSSREATQAGDELMGAWASKMKVGVALAGATAAIEFVHNVKKEFKAFEHVGEDAANTLIDGFHTVLQGKMPDLLAPFDVLEEAARTAMTAPLQIAETFIPPLGLVKRAIEDTFGPLDKLKDMLAPVMDDMIEVGDEYLEMTRKIASSTTNTEGIEELAGAVRDIMASGAVVHFKDVADSIGRLNDNIQGLSLEQLKELTKTFAEAEELVGHIDETKFAGILNAWQIPAEKATETLTVLVNTARSTGISFNEMTSEMTMSGPAMRELGYNIQDTASFFALMTEKGEKGTRLIFGMNDVVAKLNQQVEKGVFKNAKEGWQSLIDAVNAYHKAGDEAAAFDLLKQYMPANSATLMKDLMEQGIVSVDNAGVHIEGLNEDLGEAVEKTKSLGDTFMVVGQQISAAVAPVGMAMAVGLRDAGNHVTEWLKDNQGKVAQWAADIAKGFLNVGTFVTEWFANTLKAMSPLFEAMKDMVLAVTLPLSPLAHGMAAVFGGGWSTLAGAIDKVNGSMMNFNIGKYLGEFDDAVKNFATDTLPKLDAAIQAPVDDLKLEDSLKKKGFKFWFEDDDPAKVKVKPQTQDGGDVNSSADLVPPGETSLTFVPAPGWNTMPQAPTPLPGFAFGGPTVQGDWRGKGDTIPAMLEVGEYVVRRDQAQKHRRELDAINYGYAGFDTGGDVDHGLTVLYGFLRGAAEGIGLNLPKDKAGDGGSGLPAMYQNVTALSGPQLAAAAASPGHGGDVKTAAFNAMIAAGGKPSDWPAIDYIFSHESSWRTDAQNNWDINAQHGDPSKGLGQLISGNYRAAGVDPNTKDPYEQTYAAVKYMQSRYGSIQAAYAYWRGHRNYAEGGHVGGSWFGSVPHDPPGPDTASIAKHFAHFAGGGPICAECGGAHPTGFHGGVARFAGGGHIGSKEDPNGPAFSQVIWRNTETGQDIGEAGGQWVGTPGSADPGYYHRGHEDFPDHTGHVHTTVVKDPFTGAPYNQLPGNTDIRPGAPGFPDWVYRLGNQFGLQAATYPGHQVWNGINHGIDWYPKGKINNDLSDRGYTHQDHVTLTSFAQAVGQSAVGGGSAPSGGGNNVFTASYVPGSSDSGGGDGSAGAPFDGGSFPQGSPIGPQGIMGPGPNPWTNPPRGITPKQLQDWIPKYEHWQLEQKRKLDQIGDLTSTVADDWATQKQLTAQLTQDQALFNKKVDEQLKSNPAFQGKTHQEVADALAAQGDPDAKKVAEENKKLTELNKKLRDEQQDLQDRQLDQQAGNPPPQPGKQGGRGGPFESISDQLGQGLVKGIFQELGLPDVFGKPFTSWGLWRLGMGALGFGLNVAGQKGLFGGSGQDMFPGSLPGQVGGPLGTPPGPPDGSPAAAAAPASEAPGPGGGTPGLVAPPHAPAPPAAPTKPQLHWDAAKGEWFDQNNNLVQPWKFQAPTSAGGLGGNFDIGKPVPPPAPPAPRAPLQPPLGPAPHGADHWDPNKGWVDAQGNPVGTPGGGQSAPFGIPGLSNSLFGADYEAAANTPSPLSFGGDGPAAGGFGGDYMKQVVNQGPALLVGLQDKNFRAKTFGAFGAHGTPPMLPKPPLISFDSGGFNIWSSAGHAISSGAKSFGHWLMGGDHPQSLHDLPTPKSGPGQKPGPSVWDQMKQHELDPLGLDHSHESVTSKLKSSFTKKFLQALTQSEMPLPSAAAGGINLPTHATIQQPVGTRGLVQWAEPSTGGEAFIPLKGGQRSLDIWAQTGKMLGAFADGGVIDADPNAPSKLAGHMQGARPNATHTHQGGSSTTFNINQSGVMSPGQAADKIRSVAVREAAWKGPNQMFATGVQIS